MPPVAKELPSMLSAAASPSTEASNPAICKREQTNYASTGLRVVKTVTLSISLVGALPWNCCVWHLGLVQQAVLLEIFS